MSWAWYLAAIVVLLFLSALFSGSETALFSLSRLDLQQLLRKGHPVGATGIRMVCEVAEHLRGTAGDRQIPAARIGLTHNIGGPGAVAAVTILGKEIG